MARWILLNSIFILYLTLNRVGFFFEFSPVERVYDIYDLIKAFGTGLRFDLMIIGFINLPIVILFKFSFIRSKFWLWISMWLLITSFIVSLDHSLFFHTGDRVSYHTLSLPLEAISKRIEFFELGLWFSMALLFSLSCLLLREKNKANLSFKDWALIVLLSGFFARGSFGQHHLDLRHSEVTSDKFLNVVAINSIYSFDQAYKKRR